MAITNHIKGAVEKFKAKTGTDLQDHVLNATYLNGLEGTSYVDLTSAQTITGTKTFDVAYANVFATGTGAGNYFQCQKFRGEGNASTYYHALDFGYAGHNQWDFFEYGGIYNFYQNTTADGSGKVNLFQISPDGITSHKPLIAESTLTAKGAFTSNASTTLSSVKNAGILGTDSSGKVYNNSSAYLPYDNASKDIYLGSHGIHSGTRQSSGSATLMGNGYWIKPSSVGVSSSVIGGTVPSVSSEMTPDYVSISNEKIKLNSSGIVSDAGTFTFDGNPGSVATSADLRDYQKKGNYVTIDTAQTITGRKTFNSPANVNGQEVATAIFKTSNGGQLIIGKEGPNSGTMLRFDQTAGTTRLQFRASATPGAMVWTQPEKGATLYFDLTNSAGDSTRTTLDARSGKIARTSDIKNKKITIQKNGTEVGSFTTNQSSDKTINISLSKNDVGLGNVDNTADKDKNVKHASSADDSTNAFNLVSSDKHTKYTAQDFLQIYTDLDTKIPTELHDLSYGVFFRNSDGSQYTGTDGGNFPERRMITTFDNTTNPHDSDPNIGSKMVDLGTVMSAGVDSDDPQNFGGAIFANFIGPNNSVGEYSEILRQASQVASDKFRETHGASLDGGFGCLAGTAKGSLFTSRIVSSTGDIYTSALMFKPNVNSNDPDFQGNGNIAMEMKMPCFSIYNGIQVTTSGPIYDRNDVIDPLRDRNNYSVAFLAYSKTGQNVDIDRITEDYQPKGSYATTNTEQTISAKKTFSTIPVLSTLKNKKVLGTDANGLIEEHTLGISDISNLQSTINGKANSSHTHSISQITSLQSILNGKVNSDDLLKITGSSGLNGSDWHYRKIGHFIFNSSDSRNGAPVHLSGVIGDWAQGKIIFDIFVSTRGGLKVNGFVRGANPSCRLVIDNTENPNIFLAVKGFATYNITVDTFENAKNENNAVRGSFHIDWTGGDDFSGSDVGVTATNFGYQDLLNKVASQRASYAYTGSFSETSGTMTKLCEVAGGETGKIICVHGKATSANSELSIQRKTSHYHDYDCIAVAPTGYQSGTYISCTGVVPPRVQYSTTSDTPSESTYYIFGKNVSEVYVITFELP